MPEVRGNQYGVRTRPLYYNTGAISNLDTNTSTRVDATQTKTYHGILVSMSSGRSGNNGRAFQNPLGRVQSWAPQMYARSGQHVFEIGARSWGRPVDYVPGPGTSYTIDCTRVELWGDEIELNVGPRRWTDLVSQRDPFQVTEALFRGNDVYQTFTYHGCWFTTRNEEYTAEGNGKIIVNCSIAFTSRIQTI